ncbi:Integral membrane sensor signal transduction histidine kinase (plasmid) [Pseudomonas putida]|uniref:Integral membrane sensor signal transduction histidine kinase n=1 Tax=Pseudomonas putida TaxID=303 RepID=A0A1L7NPH3_PSEPU|nr:Integral membrane sensor signal transduction histidine kinase [Pseudomonas putida]
MRNRTYGGVRGLREKKSLTLLDLGIHGDGFAIQAAYVFVYDLRVITKRVSTCSRASASKALLLPPTCRP